MPKEPISRDMNYFSLRTTKNNAGEPIGPHTAHIQLTAGGDADNNFGGVLRQEFLVPILQGEHEPLAGGGSEYRLVLDDEQALLMSQMLTMCFYGVPPLN